MIINNSTGKTYKTQRDNEINPNITCLPTSLAMALIYSDVKVPTYDTFQQLEDQLTYFMNNDVRVIDFYKNNKEAWIRKEYLNKKPANEIHAVAEYALNLFVGETVGYFTTEATLRTMAVHLHSGNCCVVSGLWPYRDKFGKTKSINHVVCVVGFITTQKEIIGRNVDISQVTDFIIDDPFGDYRTLYQNHNGNDVVVPINDFNKYVKESNRLTKWCYYVGYDLDFK